MGTSRFLTDNLGVREPTCWLRCIDGKHEEATHLDCHCDGGAWELHSGYNAPERAGSRYLSAEVPWTMWVPTGWRVSTVRTDPDPRLMTGLLRMYVTSVPFQFKLNDDHPGPNAGGGASAELGDSAVVVFAQLGWYPPDDPIGWDPPTSARLRQDRLSRWHGDFQNPGWRFRERMLCSGRTCIRVLEWYGPAAAEADVARAEQVALSVRLKERWTDQAS
jgi:hypothetical protein